MKWINRCMVVLGLLFIPMIAEAKNELLGTVAGTFNDESREFYAIADNFGERSSSFMKLGNAINFTVEAYADRQRPYSSATITIEFSVKGNPPEPGPQVSDLDITYRSESGIFPYYSDEEATFELSIVEIRFDAGSAFIKANFTADLVLVEGPPKKIVGDRMAVTGSFEVEARK